MIWKNESSLGNSYIHDFILDPEVILHGYDRR